MKSRFGILVVFFVFCLFIQNAIAKDPNRLSEKYELSRAEYLELLLNLHCRLNADFATIIYHVGESGIVAEILSWDDTPAKYIQNLEQSLEMTIPSQTEKFSWSKNLPVKFIVSLGPRPK